MSYTLDAWWSPNKNKGYYPKIGFTIHHAATTNFSVIGQTFQNTYTQSSAHYGVEPGHVQQYVEDSYIAWHAGNAWANRSTIGIECVNSGGEYQGWPVAEATIDTLVEFMADKAKEWGIKHLTVGDNLFGHKDFSATFCPGVLYPRLQEIADRVNALLEGDDMFSDSDRAMLQTAYSIVSDESDPTGRDKEGNIAWKIKWMAAKQEAMQESIDKLAEKVDKMVEINGTMKK